MGMDAEDQDAGGWGAPSVPGWTDDDSPWVGWPTGPAPSGEQVPTAAVDPTPQPEPTVSKPRSHPARLALGVVLLAADRVRVGAPSEGFEVGVGLAQQTVDEMRGLARRAFGPPTRAASRTLDWASKQTGVATNRGVFGRTRARVGQLMLEARNAGRATIAAGREDATTFVRNSVADGMAWAETQAVPRIVDSLVPHLVDSVVPRLIDGVMPEIRSKVLPAVVDDLTDDPKIRELVMEQSRGVIGEAAEDVRSGAARADDRVEAAFRRLIGAGPEKAEPTTEETRATNHDG
jgi:hypothetical protein